MPVQQVLEIVAWVWESTIPEYWTWFNLPSQDGNIYHSIYKPLMPMFMNVFINNNVVILEIWIWVCGLRDAEDDTYLCPLIFRDKGAYNNPIEGG